MSKREGLPCAPVLAGGTLRAMTRLVLASTSRYRRELLSRLRVPFDCAAPAVDESPLPGESPFALVTRLGRAKARAVADRQPGALVIGSDQMAVIDGKALGKPHGFDRNVAILLELAGRRVQFLTSLCLVDTRTGGEQLERPGGLGLHRDRLHRSVLRPSPQPQGTGR